MTDTSAQEIDFEAIRQVQRQVWSAGTLGSSAARGSLARLAELRGLGLAS